jgi:hypothetical protein
MAGSMIYGVVPGAIQTTNVTPLTFNDNFFVKSGATRNVGINGFYFGGRGAGLTQISGISYRLEKWTSTASSAGTAITPAPKDIGFQAAKHTAGFSATVVTSGTGGPTLLLSLLSGATGPTTWVAPNPTSVHILEGAATQSIDIFMGSGTASMNVEGSLETIE